MAIQTLTKKDLAKIGVGVFFRPKDLDGLGISFPDLKGLLGEGVVERIGRGLYRLAAAEPTENYSLAAVCAWAPGAIVCLLSALQYHKIGTQLPREIWIAIPHKARPPQVPGFPIRIIRFSGPSLKYGVENVRLEGVPARLTSPARTIVDCFRFRRIIGKDVSLEAIREGIHERKANREEIWRAAEACRAKSIVGPYLEALSS